MWIWCSSRREFGPPMDGQTTHARTGCALIFHSKNIRRFNRALGRDRSLSLVEKDASALHVSPITRTGDHLQCESAEKHAYRGSREKKKHSLSLWTAADRANEECCNFALRDPPRRNTINSVYRAKRAVKEFPDSRVGVARLKGK